VPGDPDPHNPQFVADQGNLSDAVQFGDRRLYPTGYHWRIDPAIGPTGIASANAVFSRGQLQWGCDIRFTPQAALHWAADTQAAFGQPSGSPMNHIAVFVGSRVVWAPAVVQLSTDAVEMTTDESPENAVATCAAIAAAAGR
jgi:hypothetical protein